MQMEDLFQIPSIVLAAFKCLENIIYALLIQAIESNTIKFISTLFTLKLNLNYSRGPKKRSSLFKSFLNAFQIKFIYNHTIQSLFSSIPFSLLKPRPKNRAADISADPTHSGYNGLDFYLQGSTTEMV